MNENEIKQKLDKLADYQSQLDILSLDKQKLVDSVLTPEIKQQLADIEAEFAVKGGIAAMNRDDLEMEIKKAVRELGASVKGTVLHAIFMKGRVSWDSKKLEGLMMIVPQMKDARKEGEPSVSIRKIGG
jgi:hypothetical protein